MARERTTTSYAILGLLTLRDWTTYELAKQVQRSLNWFWPRAERKLYDEPKRLVDGGLATAVREHTGARGRTVYGVTDAGRDALRAWLGEAPAPRSTEFEGMAYLDILQSAVSNTAHDSIRCPGTSARRGGAPR